MQKIERDSQHIGGMLAKVSPTARALVMRGGTDPTALRELVKQDVRQAEREGWETASLAKNEGKSLAGVDASVVCAAAWQCGDSGEEPGQVLLRLNPRHEGATQRFAALAQEGADDCTRQTVQICNLRETRDTQRQGEIAPRHAKRRIWRNTGSIFIIFVVDTVVNIPAVSEAVGLFSYAAGPPPAVWILFLTGVVGAPVALLLFAHKSRKWVVPAVVDKAFVVLGALGLVATVVSAQLGSLVALVPSLFVAAGLWTVARQAFADRGTQREELESAEHRDTQFREKLVLAEGEHAKSEEQILLAQEGLAALKELELVFHSLVESARCAIKVAEEKAEQQAAHAVEAARHLGHRSRGERDIMMTDMFHLVDSQVAE
jgi:hypothetical protein